MEVLELSQSFDTLGAGHKYAKVEGFKGGFSVAYYVKARDIQQLHDLLVEEGDLFGAHIWWERGDKMMFTEPAEYFYGRRHVVLSNKVIKTLNQ